MGGYIERHHLIEEKRLPESFIELQRELALPHNEAVSKEAAKAGSFEEALGTIAALCDIALDGLYEVPDLCDLLVKALRAGKGVKGAASKISEKLVSAELIEREGEVSLEFGVEEAKVKWANPEVEAFQRLMIEHGCSVCNNREACKAAGRCLGDLEP